MKMRLIIIFACLFCLSVFFVGCKTLSPNITPLSDEDTFFNSAGVDIKRPSGNNWYLHTPQRNVLAFSQIPDSDTHTFVISVYTKNLFYNRKLSDQSKLLQYVREQKKKDTDPKSFKNVKFDLKIDSRYGKSCIKYKIECEDQRFSNLKNKEVYMRIIGYFFLHPMEPRLAYDVFYYERGTVDEFNSKLKVIGEEFIDMNLSITDPSNRRVFGATP